MGDDIKTLLCKESTFKGQVRIAGEFENMEFMRCDFLDDLRLDRSVIQKIADFKESHFRKILSFCSVEFKCAPNLSSSLCDKKILLANSKMDFSFSELKKCVKSSVSKNEYLKHDIAADYRDTFRLFKSLAITNNNSIQAAKQSRLELYAAEIELGFKVKDAKTLRNFLDYAQLFLYRHLCDHHTDLKLMFGWMIVFCGYYGLLLMALKFNPFNEIYLPFISAIIVLFFTLFNKFIRLALGLIGLVSTALYAPKYLFGITAILDKSSSILLNIVTFLYTILLPIFIFSLQKTLRKNTF